MENSVYLFDLKLLCGGYAYYSTHTRFKKFCESNREVREPSQVRKDGISKSLSLLGHSLKVIENDKDYTSWLYVKGWALVPENLAREMMPQWLKKKECLSTPLGIFIDLEIVSPKNLKRSYSGKQKESILDRDGRKCLLCGQDNGLTMQHVVPFSKGGETSSRNMVTLCNSCNQSLEAEPVYELYRLAGLHCNYDPSLINPKGVTLLTLEKAIEKAVGISSNLMNTRCEVW